MKSSFTKIRKGNIKIDVRLEDETVWLTQAQLCELFQKSKATISEHVTHIFEEGELQEEATVRKFRTVQQEGSRSVERELEYYNLDVIISVGYRVKSPQGTQFRIWATQRLKEYIFNYTTSLVEQVLAADSEVIAYLKGCAEHYNERRQDP